MATFVLFMIFSFVYGSDSFKKVNLEKPIEVVLKSVKGETMDFWNVVNLGIDEAAKEFGVQVNVSGPNFEKEINKQITILNKIIEDNPPIIILAASDYKRLTASIDRADYLEIPVITLDSGVDSNYPESFVGTNNIIAGEKAGRELKRLLEDSNKKEIAIVAHLKETNTAIDREQGVRNALDEENIIGTWFCDVEEDKAYYITLGLLKNSNLGGIVALNEVAALGVARAIQETNSQDIIKVVGFDNSARELTFLEAGVLDATVVQRPYNMGYLAVKTAVEHLSGDKVEANIDTGSVLITKVNMFKREYQDILFPFQ